MTITESKQNLKGWDPIEIKHPSLEIYFMKKPEKWQIVNMCNFL